jgi:hypothetical protein
MDHPHVAKHPVPGYPPLPINPTIQLAALPSLFAAMTTSEPVRAPMTIVELRGDLPERVDDHEGDGEEKEERETGSGSS